MYSIYKPNSVVTLNYFTILRDDGAASMPLWEWWQGWQDSVENCLPNSTSAQNNRMWLIFKQGLCRELRISRWNHPGSWVGPKSNCWCLYSEKWEYRGTEKKPLWKLRAEQCQDSPAAASSWEGGAGWLLPRGSRRTQPYQHLDFCLPQQLGTNFMLCKATWSAVIAHGSPRELIQPLIQDFASYMNSLVLGSS